MVWGQCFIPSTHMKRGGFNTSSIVPYFILTEMPPFVPDCCATIFAAADLQFHQANSISACLSVISNIDFR